jgi:hypothetical protein
MEVVEVGGAALGHSLPSLADVATMNGEERRSLFLRLAVLSQQVAAAMGMVATFLGVASDEPLWDAKEAARVLGVSVDTIRERGAEWGIQADLGPGIYRYVPERVRALRESRKQPETRHPALALR